MDSEKSSYLRWKKRVTWVFFEYVVKKFAAFLWYEINVLDMFNIVFDKKNYSIKILIGIARASLNLINFNV